MHEVSDFHVEILVNHKRSILCKAIDKNSVCCLPTYPRKLAFWLPFGCFFQNFGPVLSDVLYLDYSWTSQTTVLAWYPSVPGRPTVLDNCRAHYACIKCGWGLFLPSSPIISLFPYRLKYFLKGPLKPKQQQQHKFNFGYSLTE